MVRRAILEELNFNIIIFIIENTPFALDGVLKRKASFPRFSWFHCLYSAFGYDGDGDGDTDGGGFCVTVVVCLCHGAEGSQQH